MKPYTIDVENIRGLAFHGHSVELQGAMNVRPDTQPREGVFDSSLHMSLGTARTIHGHLTQLLREVDKRTAAPPAPR